MPPCAHARPDWRGVFDAVSYPASVVTLALIQSRFQAERDAPPRHVRREVREGFGGLRLHRFSSTPSRPSPS
jgi:hypothetical protein